jgi:glycosyltransferase involved in cell wall biosynthesis
MRIVAFHLLNDYSGSPKVLSQLLKGWVKTGHETHIVTCKGRKGFLSDIEGVKYHFYTYKFAPNPLIRLFNLLLSQFIVILKMLFFLKKNDIVYVNTVLPFGGAIIGKIKGCRVIYHIHETSMKPLVLKKFLFGIVKKTAKDVIYVSNYLAEQERLKKIRKHTVYNAIESDFLNYAENNRREHINPSNVLLVCSLKEYKGVNEFLEIASKSINFNFKLVVNANHTEIDSYFKSFRIPENLKIFSTQTNLHPFYQWADIILNLSKPDGWIETFGLTIIEGMSYGLPAIVPEIGGITELVDNNINGYKIDSKKVIEIVQKIQLIFSDKELYHRLNASSIQKIKNFDELTQFKAIEKILN